MGLTNQTMGTEATDSGLIIQKRSEEDRVVALAGNPNVGKSTVFNSLTRMHQHTGNWPGKTVENAQGYCSSRAHTFVMVDIPGTYSLLAHSTEEEVARNFVCFGEPDAIAVVCDATCLERNLNLVLQLLEITTRVVVCVNLMDEAKRKQIRVDLSEISSRLGVPVVGTVARQRKSLAGLLLALDEVLEAPPSNERVLKVRYHAQIEEAVAIVEPVLAQKLDGRLNSRWLSLRLLDPDNSLIEETRAYLGADFLEDAELNAALQQARALLEQNGMTPDHMKDLVVSALVHAAEDVCKGCVVFEKASYNESDRRIDRVLTSKRVGYPVMILLLGLVFWLTIAGANVPSQWIANGLFRLQESLSALFVALHAPDWLHGVLVLGMYRVLAWVVSVMLPPMAIFFPLFTLLEDAGYLPRVAYNLDKPFKKCCACGKQALSMWVVDNGMRMGMKMPPGWAAVKSRMPVGLTTYKEALLYQLDNIFSVYVKCYVMRSRSKIPVAMRR